MGVGQRNEDCERGGMNKIDGEVYCLDHCGVHDDTTDPYGYGEPDCRKSEHRLIYWRERVGDITE